VKIAFNAGWDPKSDQMDVNVGNTKKKSDKNEKGMTHEIELNFIRDDTPEGLAKVTNELMKVI
jgi:hypothetical protein